MDTQPFERFGNAEFLCRLQRRPRHLLPVPQGRVREQNRPGPPVVSDDLSFHSRNDAASQPGQQSHLPLLAENDAARWYHPATVGSFLRITSIRRQGDPPRDPLARVTQGHSVGLEECLETRDVSGVSLRFRYQTSLPWSVSMILPR